MDCPVSICWMVLVVVVVWTRWHQGWKGAESGKAEVAMAFCVVADMFC